MAPPMCSIFVVGVSWSHFPENFCVSIFQWTNFKILKLILYKLCKIFRFGFGYLSQEECPSMISRDNIGWYLWYHSNSHYHLYFICFETCLLRLKGVDFFKKRTFGKWIRNFRKCGKELRQWMRIQFWGSRKKKEEKRGRRLDVFFL